MHSIVKSSRVTVLTTFASSIRFHHSGHRRPLLPAVEFRPASLCLYKASRLPDKREVRRERLVERSDTRTKKWTIQRRVPASQESGSEFRHWRVQASDEFRPPKSPAVSSGLHEFRHTTSPTSQMSGSESGIQRIRHEFGIPLLMQRWRKFALKSCPATTPLSQVFPTTLQSRATSILVAGQLPVLLWPFLRKGVWRPHLPRNFWSTF